MASSSHSIIVIEDDLDEKNKNKVKLNFNENEESKQLHVEVEDAEDESSTRKVSFLDLSVDEPSPSSSKSIPLRWKSAASASVKKKDPKLGNFVTLKDHLATKLSPSNPLMSSFSKPKPPGTPKTKAQERWLKIRASVVKNPSKPQSIIDVIRLAKSFELLKMGIRRKESHYNHQQKNLVDKKEKRKIGALMLGCLIEADLPDDFLNTLCKSQQLQRMIQSFASGSSQSKQLLTDLCLNDSH